MMGVKRMLEKIRYSWVGARHASPRTAYHPTNKKAILTLLVALLTLLLSGCQLGAVTLTESAPAPLASPDSISPGQSPNDTPVPLTVGEEPPLERRVWLHPGLPPRLSAAAATLFSDPAAGFVPGATREESVIQIALAPDATALLKTEWLYAVVAPFPTVPDNISWEGLGRYWQGQTNALPQFGTPNLVLSPHAVEVLTVIYGPPAVNILLAVVPSEQVLDQAFAARPALSVVPFEDLQPGWKVLNLDGQTPLDKALNTADYRMQIEVGIAGDPLAASQAAEIIQAGGQWSLTNRDPSRMTIVTMTGVTALSRAVAWQMELTGIEAQGANIKPLLSDADILHLSNEVSFAANCPPPDPSSEAKFCSDDSYLDLLLDLNPDVIELTGNHINDWGTQAFVHTLDIYDENSVPYFGGGRTLEESKRTLIISSFGNRIAFVGCNLPGPYSAWATEATAGASPCDDYEAFKRQITAAAEQADVVIVTQQYWEFAHPEPTPQQVADFAALVDAGADIVSGSQAHQPQSFALHNGRFVHYGLGNLFFDPLQAVEKQFFIDKHIIYEGRHISTVLLTGMLENYGRPRPMTLEERRQFLAAMFGISGW